MLLFFFCACTRADTADSVGPGAFACGETVCAGDQLCIETVYDPVCTNRDDTGAACPDGTTASQCGGDGHACCCEPTPPASYACVDAAGCGEVPTCDCVTCDDEKWCSMSGAESGRQFQCASPAVP